MSRSPSHNPSFHESPLQAAKHSYRVDEREREGEEDRTASELASTKAGLRVIRVALHSSGRQRIRQREQQTQLKRMKKQKPRPEIIALEATRRFFMSSLAHGEKSALVLAPPGSPGA